MIREDIFLIGKQRKIKSNVIYPDVRFFVRPLEN